MLTKTRLALIAGLALTLLSSEALARYPVNRSPPTVEVVPGVSIGPIRLGMTRTEVGKLGLADAPGFTASVRMIGPYEVVFDKDVVTAVSLDLGKTTSGVHIGDKVIPRAATLAAAAKLAPSCMAPAVVEGGTVIWCANHALIIKQGEGKTAKVRGPVEVQIILPPPPRK